MILLRKKDYGRLVEPLKAVTFNYLFARSVIEKKVAGSVYVDSREDPRTYYILHPYGMSLLFGAFDNARFNADFRSYALNNDHQRNRDHWLQVFPDSWNSRLLELFDGRMENPVNSPMNRIELHTRVNFRFNPHRYQEFRWHKIDNNSCIVRTNAKIFSEMSGSVVPVNFWNTAEEFCKKGVGFSLFDNQELRATAFSSCILDDKLELGIETKKGFRSMGYAQHVCSALIDYCMENQYEPIWSCRLGNVGSYKLALKLGFGPTLRLNYYKLCI